MTEGAGLDVGASQTQHQGAHGFGGVGDRRGGLAEETSAVIEFFAAVAVGQDPEMSNTDEPVRDDMEQEPTEELLRFELHDLACVGVGVVLPAEPNHSVFETEDALIGDGHAMGVPAQVLEDLLRAGEGSFGVNNPGLATESAEPRMKHLRRSQGSSRSGEDEFSAVE